MKQLRNSIVAGMLLLCVDACQASQTAAKPVTSAMSLNEVYCQAGCQHLQVLGCPEGQDLKFKNGTTISCQQFCQDSMENGLDLHPQTWLTISSCQQLEAE